MKRMIKKTLVYMIMFVMLMPAWLLSDFLSAPRAEAATGGPSLVINEIMSHPASGSEWVELLNLTESSVSLSGWKLTELSSPSSVAPTENNLPALSGSIPAYGLATVDVSNLNDDGDSVGLYNSSTEISRVSYGNVNSAYHVATLTNSYVTSAPAQGKTISYVPVQDGAGSYVTNSTATKGWFNANAPTIAQIVSGLSGITTNLESLNPSAAAGLYFEKTGYGKITFSATLNLTDQKTAETLSNLSTSIDFSEGKIKFAPATGDILATLGGNLEMYNLPFANGIVPAIQVDGQTATADDVASAVYADGTLTFTAKHFSTYSVDITGPVLNDLGFTSNSVDVSEPASGGYYVVTDNQASTNYNISFKTMTEADEALKAGYYGLYLEPMTGQTAALTSYYSSKPEPWKSYLDNAAVGTDPLYPFAVIKADGTTKPVLLDGAQYEILSAENPMVIPGDYPEGTYTVSGDICDLAGNKTKVTFKMVIDRTLPSVSFVHESDANLTLNNGATYSDPELTATDNGEAVIPVRTPATIDTTVAGPISVKYAYTDAAGNEAEVTRNLIVLPATKVIALDTNTVSTSVPEVVISAGKTTDTTVTVPIEVTNAKVNVTVTTVGTQNQATLSGNLVINATTSAGTMSVTIPAGTVISGSTDWNGAINVPTLLANTAATVPADSGMTVTVSNIVEVGFGDVKLSLSNPVRLVLAGQAGKLAGYSRGGVFTKISTVCPTDSGAGLGADGDCYLNVGSDLVIWTRHFTKFVAYSETQTPVVVTTSAINSLVSKAKAAETVTPAPEKAVEVPNDEGIIKGTDVNNQADDINWTPWIVLFTLIVLAGAATGGYFYWFAGHEEIEPIVKGQKPKAAPKKVEEKIEKKEIAKPQPKAKAKAKPADKKKTKRW